MTTFKISRGQGLRRRMVAAAIAASAAAGLASAPADAVPVRGHSPWSVLLCKFSDQSAEPRTPQYYQQLVTDAGRGMGGVADYFDNQSGGRLTLRGSTVRGWYTMPFTLAQQGTKNRWQKTQDCVDTAARNGYRVPAGHRVMAVTNAPQDAGGAGDRVLLDPNTSNVGFAAHEMGHSYGLGHSWSDDLSYRNVDWAQPGEYDDPWDLMSAMNIFTFETANFSTSAVGLNAYNRDRLGWLPRTRIFTFGADGVTSRNMILTSLEAPLSSGMQLVRVPYSVNDPYRYFTVELRRKTGVSAGIPADTVLIHDVQDRKPILLRTRGGDRAPAQSVNANGVTIRVTSAGANWAQVAITSSLPRTSAGRVHGPNTCRTGYVWREADVADYVCVTPETRRRVAADNRAASSRWRSGAFGPHTCITGYVWRDAFPGDDVCVTPSQRTLARQDNAAAASRVLRP